MAKDCYAMKLELLTNATVVDDAIRFLAVNPDVTKVVDALRSRS